MAYVQESAAVGTGALSLTGVVAGNAILVVVVQQGNGSRTYSTSDDVDGSYGTPDLDFAAANKRILVWSKKNVTGGSPNITVTQGGGSAVGFRSVAIEWSNLDAGGTPVTGTLDSTGTNQNTHFCAPLGSIDTSGACAVLAAGVLTSTAGVSGTTAGATYTEIDLGQTAAFLQYKAAASALTDDRGEWSSGGTARPDMGGMIAYPEAAAGGGTSILRQMLQHHHRQSQRRSPQWRRHESGLYLRAA